MIRRGVLALTTTAVATLVALGAAGGAQADATQATTSLVQQATVSWKDGKSLGNARATFAIPGIGSGDIICRRDAVLFRMTPTNRRAETSMWSTLEQVKNGATSYAVHDARVYTFSTPTSTVPHGSGPAAQEGLNLWTPIEDSGSGSAVGLISQRTGRNVPAAGQVPSTSFTVTWSWSSFGNPSTSRCRIAAVFTTQLPAGSQVQTLRNGNLLQLPGAATNGFALDWHGDADAATGKLASAPAQIPYLGAISAVCPTGRGSKAGWSIHADDPGSGLTARVETYQGEGPNAKDVDTYAVGSSGSIGPVRLPVNGMQRVTLTGGGHTATLVITSVRKTNDPAPAENFCEVAGQSVSG